MEENALQIQKFVFIHRSAVFLFIEAIHNLNWYKHIHEISSNLVYINNNCNNILRYIKIHINIFKVIYQREYINQT